MKYVKKEILQPVKNRRYLNKTFSSFHADMLEYYRTYYPDKLKDLSESSIGGLLLDLPAYVGDVLSYYLDTQYTELDPEFAIEDENIERCLRLAGVKITGAANAIVDCTFYVEIPALANNEIDETFLPIIRRGTIVVADNGVEFTLLKDVDFTEKLSNGTYKNATYVPNVRGGSTIRTWIFSKKGQCASGSTTTQSFSIGSFVPFRTITLQNPHVTEIISVVDDDGNKYYETEHLTNDVVFRASTNASIDSEIVDDALEIIPAPYRFVTTTDVGARITTLMFGGGNADTIDDDVIPDPSEFALPLYGKTTFTRTMINPNQMLQTRTLGVCAENVTLRITYRHGGGLHHNVDPGSITSISTIGMSFPNSRSPQIAAAVQRSVQVFNELEAGGGEDAPTLSELRQQIPAARNAQSRIVSKPDLLSRVYTMPSNFGRVFRASVKANTNNPLASQLYIISRNNAGQLTHSTDTLKQNIATYLNEFRQISDAIDILDARVINIVVKFECMTNFNKNKNLLAQEIIGQINAFFDIKNFQIDQPIVIADVLNIIFNTQGVVAMSPDRLTFSVINGEIGDRMYSDVVFNVKQNTRRGMIIPPPGGIFEVKYPEHDIIGTVL